MLSKQLHNHANTASLKERHRAVYEELFHVCTTVVSIPLTIVWSPNHAVGPGGIGIVSKLPLRCYVGIEPVSGDTVELHSFKYYIPEEDAFHEWKDKCRTPRLFTDILQAFAAGRHQASGARIWCITELPWYRGLNMEAHSAAGIAAAWCAHLRVITAAVAANFASLSGSQLTADETFNVLFRLAWKLESVLINDVADGHVVAGGLVDAEYPIIYYREQDPYLFGGGRDFGISHPSSYYNITDSMNYSVHRMDEIFHLDRLSLWPIDMALLHVGECGDGHYMNQIRKAYTTHLNDAAALAKEAFQSLTPKTFAGLPRFLHLFETEPQNSPGVNLYHAFRATSVVHSMTVLKTMRNFFQIGASQDVLRKFLDAQNLCQDILRLLGLSNIAIDQAATSLRFLGAKKTSTGVAARLIGLGGHGALLVVGQQEQLADCLDDVAKEIANNAERRVHCHFASWCDTSKSSTGLRIEQDLQGALYSSFTTNRQLTIWEWRGGVLSKPRLITGERWQKEQKCYDVIFDGRERKIYAGGAQLTARVIHSAKRTIELMRYFIQSNKSEIFARELSASCYSADRNQMESKIIRPINCLVKEKTGYDFGLRAHGGLASHYSVQFFPHKRLNICFVSEE